MPVTNIFYLELEAPGVSAEEVAHAVRDIAVSADLVEDFDPARLLNGMVTLHSGLWVDVSAVDQPDHAVADLGVEPSVSVWLQVNGTISCDPQRRALLTVALGLLDRVPGNAVLHFEYAEVHFVRRAGRLLLSNRDDVWRQRYLAMVRHPYERTRLDIS